MRLHSDLYRSPGVRFYDRSLGIGIGVVDPLLNGDVSLKMPMGHVELMQAVEATLNPRRCQKHLLMPA